MVSPRTVRDDRAMRDLAPGVARSACSMTREVDLLIIGSGPAGCSTALHLARLAPGLARRTVVLDRSEHPRHKLCGGGLVSDVDTILANLGLDLDEVPHVDAEWARLHFQGRGIRHGGAGGVGGRGFSDGDKGLGALSQLNLD